MADEKDKQQKVAEEIRQKLEDLVEGDQTDRDKRLRAVLEGFVPDVVKRAMLSGLGALFVTEETIRSAVSDVPKEAVGYVLQQADNTKDQFLSLVATEVREFLGEINVGEELARILSTMTLDIHTQIRFEPDEDAEEGDEDLKPDVKTDLKLTRTRKRRTKKT